MIYRSIFIGATVAGFGSGLALADGKVQYRVVPIPVPDGAPYLFANDLNDSDQVLAETTIATESRAVLYSDGVSKFIDGIPGTHGAVVSINDGGHIAGWMYEWGIIWPEAYVWDGKEAHPLGTLGAEYSYADGMNDHGDVVGFIWGGVTHPNGNAFVYRDGEMIDLGGGQALDISNNRRIVGLDNRGFGEAQVWEPKGDGWTIVDLKGSGVNDINDDGTMIAGIGEAPIYLGRAAIWERDDDGWMRIDLGDFDPNESHSVATSVNNAGQAVGTYSEFTVDPQAFLYEDGKLTWLTDRLSPDSSGWSITDATAINNAGHILARGTLDGLEHAVLLVPDQLSVLGPRPGVAGETNTLIAMGATPGARVYFVYGLAEGGRSVPVCPDLQVGIASPRIAGSALADDEGEARMSTFIPPAASGLAIYLQAVEPGSCQAGNVMRYVLR